MSEPGRSHELAATRLRERTDRIIELWKRRVREQLPEARQRDETELLDDMPDVLERLAKTLASADPEQDLERGVGRLASDHGRQRAELTAYSLHQVIHEYQVLHGVLIEILDDDGELIAQTHDLIGDALLVAVRNAASEFAKLRGNVTESALRETDVRFRHMVEAVKDYAIFTVDPNGYVTSWNEGCVRMKRYTADEAIGMHFSQLYPEEGKRRDEPMGHLRTAAIEGRFRGEGVRLRKDGEEFFADVSITPIYDGGKLTGFTKVVQDLTERAALIQERDLSREDSVQLRGEAEYRERYVATLSHDLRSPLAAAKSGADLLARFPDDAERVRAWATRIADSLERADRMISDFLDASRLHVGESLALEFGSCDLLPIIRGIRDELAIRYRNRIDVRTEGSTVGVWSAEGLRRVFENLLSNAIKYGDSSRPITIRAQRIDDRMLLSVHNYGQIIPLEDQTGLFKPFHRVTATAASKPGWGLGLALVKGIVEAHGGIVKAQSYPKEGTTFTIDIPAEARPPLTRAADTLEMQPEH